MTEPTMRERLARALRDNIKSHIISRESFVIAQRIDGIEAAVDAILAELHEPTEGMVAAMRDNVCDGAMSAFTAAIDEAGKP